MARLITFDDDGTPIYLQIVKKIKAEIISGSLAAGDRVPSVREAAETYRVNPNTMHRVMAELERDGVISSQRGVGFFVTQDAAKLDQLRRAEGLRVAGRFLAEMAALGFSRDEAEALFDQVYERH